MTPSIIASGDLDRIIDPLRSAAWQAEAESSLQALVEISSHTSDRPGCQAMAEALVALLRRPGLHVERRPDPTSVYGDHVLFSTDTARLDASSPPFTLLIGHLDTVFAASTFQGYRTSNTGGVRRAHGPGVHDMKGGLVAIAFAFRALAESGLLSSIPLRGAIVSDEEVGSPTGRETLLSIASGAACALGFESGRAGDAIITRRKGLGAIKAVATGKAAHAGNLHHEGHNAIWALSRFVDAAQRLTDYDRGVTVNVGKIEGGQGRNIVPDHAEAVLDFRFVSLAEAASIEAALKEAARSAALPGTTVTLTGGVTRLPLCRSEASARLFAAYADCQRAAGLGAAEAPLLGGGSDASTVAGLNIPAIDGLAPRGSGFHTLEEQIELGTILPKAEALLRFLVSGYSAVQVRTGPVSA